MNTAGKPISQAQLRALQTLFGLYARKYLDAGANGRSERLAWASQTLGRTVASFSDLSGDEAARLVSILKQTLGQETKNDERKRRNREAALAYGTHGRIDRPIKIEIMATADDIEAVNELRERLGMSQEDFAGWLASRSSPIRGRSMPVLRTVADCNRVRWALKAMLKRHKDAAA